MDEAQRTQFHQLSERIADLTHVANSLVEAEKPSLDEIDQLGADVDQVNATYHDLLQQVPDDDRERVERQYGRRVTDLRRLIARLPLRRGGSTTKRAADAGQPFLLSRSPGKSIAPDRLELRPTGIRVGAELTAWCGPCGGLTEHTIVAVVDGQPKQVACDSCRARHGYRTSPARSKGAAAAGAKSKPVVDEATRKQDERLAFAKELNEATNVKPFSIHERFRKGDYIEHAEHGRGKVEEVLRGSLLVRFRHGLRPVNLF